MTAHDVMTLSLADQALWAVVERGRTLAPGAYVVPCNLDLEIARLTLAPMDVHIDDLTPDQAALLSSWAHGT